jgi:hypothetical protein
MKKILLLVLSIPLLSIAILAQTPSPSEGNSPGSNVNQAKSSPSPGPTTQNSPGMTLIKWGDFQVTTGDIRVVALLGGLALLGLGGYLILRWKLRHRERGARSWLFSKGIVIISIATLLLFGTTLLLFGIWLGGRNARSEVQQYIDANRLTVSQGQLSQITMPTPTATPQPSTTPQPNPTPEVAGASWPFYIVVMVFVLLVGIEAALFVYIYARWGRWALYERALYRRGLHRKGLSRDALYHELDRIKHQLARISDDVYDR